MWGAAVLAGADLIQVTNADLIKAGGAWPWIGVVKNVADLVLGAVALPVIAAMYYLYYRRPRPGPPLGPWWSRRWADLGLGVLAIVGWIALWVLPGRSRARKIRVSFEIVFGIIITVIVGIDSGVLNTIDLLSAVVVGFLTVTVLWGWLGGRAFVRAADWAQADVVGVAGSPSSGQAYSTASSDPAPRRSVMPQAPSLSSPEPESRPKQKQSSKASPAESESVFHVVAPSQRPSFADVGGMAAVKREIAETIGTVLAYGPEADAYGLHFNGLLLHGRPGTGKTFIARAAAGEYGMSFIHVTMPWT